MANPQAARVLLQTIVDTSWRMIVPTAILVPLGILGDLRFRTAPGLTLAGLLGGLAISTQLIRAQLHRTAS